ncbi:MAG: hypothetical protein LIO79_03965 [Rikenellaceae bacterium]|nr:hypothetical protein [Rikenellaceae bacterium]
MKYFNKEGWQIAQSSLPIDAALARHYDRIYNNDNMIELVGTTVNAKTLRLGADGTSANAISNYAKNVSSSILGKIEAKGAIDQVTGAQRDFLHSNYSIEIEKLIIRDIEPSFTVVKKNKKSGTMEYETYYVLDENKAKLTREEAMINTLRNANAPTELTQEIREIIRQMPE